MELILSETKRPTRFGQYDYYLVLYQAGKIPEAKLKPLFEDKQWALLKRQLNQRRGMEQFLRSQGLLPAETRRPRDRRRVRERPAPAREESERPSRRRVRSARGRRDRGAFEPEIRAS